MNCFAARNDFVAFWQKTLDDERRAQLLTHLGGCGACDHSFRTFALIAPVLYSATEPDWNLETPRPIRLNPEEPYPSSAPSTAKRGSLVPAVNRVVPVFVRAAAAALVLYFSAPPRMTFEDAIAADNSNAEVASYPPTDSFFGQELMAQNSTAPDLSDE